MGSRGVAVEVDIAWRELMRFKPTFTDPVPELQEQTYRGKGIDTIHGRATVTGANTLDVDGETLDAKHIVLASAAGSFALAQRRFQVPRLRKLEV